MLLPVNRVVAALALVLNDGGDDAITSLDRSSLTPPSADSWEWWLGIILCLLAAALTNLGLTVQKYSFLRSDARHAAATHAHRSYNPHLQPLWLAGLSIFLLGQVMNFAAFGYTSQALAATLGAFSLVTNGIFAPLILKERITWQMVAAIAVIVAGSGMVVMASSRARQEYSLDELIHLYQRDLFILYVSTLMVALISAFILMWREDRRWKRAMERHQQSVEHAEADADAASPTDECGVAMWKLNNGAMVPVQDGSASESELDVEREVGRQSNSSADKQPHPQATNGTNHAVNIKSIDVEPVNERSYLLGSRSSPANHSTFTSNSPQPSSSPSTTSSADSRFQLPSPPSSVGPVVAGSILSSFSVLFGKCTVQLIKTSFERANQFNHGLSWVLTSVFVICALGAVGYLNRGLRRGTALFVVPLYYVLSTLLAIIGGLVYFEEFAHFSLLQGSLFGAGVILTIAGVYMSSRSQMSADEEMEEKELERERMEEEEGEEETTEVDEESARVDISKPLPVAATVGTWAGKTTPAESEQLVAAGIDVSASAVSQHPSSTPTLTEAAEVNGKKPKRSRPSVRFGSDMQQRLSPPTSSPIELSPPADAAAPPHPQVRFVRAASAPDGGLTAEQLAALLDATERGEDTTAALTSLPSTTAATLAPRTPQPAARVLGYGGVDSTVPRRSRSHSTSPSPSPSPPRPHSLSHPASISLPRTRMVPADVSVTSALPSSLADRHRLSELSALRRTLTTMPLTQAQKRARERRDRLLAEAEQRRRRWMERRRTVAVIGLGIA